MKRPSAQHNEAAGPTDLLSRRELDLKKSKCLELASARQRASVEGVQTASLNGRDKSRFRVGVVTCDKNRGRIRTYLFRAECGRKVRVERLEYPGRRQRSGKIREDKVIVSRAARYWCGGARTPSW